MESLKILGHKVARPVRQLETFPAPDDVTQVVLCTEEFTSLCPVTGQPDWCRVTLEYKPLKLVNLVVFDRRKYGSTMLVFFEINPDTQ